MKKNYQKDYIEVSTEFRNSKGSKESIGKLYDLLYELEKVDKTNKENLTLSNIYTLLGLHQSAYEIFKPIVNQKDRKETTKLYVLEQKAKSHGNNFVIKDKRKLENKKEQTKLLCEDFLVDKEKTDTIITNKNIVVFNKKVEHDKFQINIYGNHTFEDYQTKIIDYIFWLGDCKKELIKFYNQEFSEETKERADKDWYDTLEVYSINVGVAVKGNLFAEISTGDNFVPDHILDIGIEEQKITEMSYDG